MPVWHEAAKQHVADGKLKIIGVIQEQHAERCRLYSQWKQFDFPILQDQFTGNGLAVVPVPIFIDEFGVVQNKRPKTSQLEEFVNQEFEPPEKMSEVYSADRTDLRKLYVRAKKLKTPDAFCELGDAYLKWGKDQSIDLAIDAYETASRKIESNPDQTMITAGQMFFRMGAAYRARYDSPAEFNKWRSDDDFNMAAVYWSEALKNNPNQYIWRRRIQQYGPRLAKPYPFYDWVETAQNEIRQRGETPIELTVALTDSEVASPSRKFATQNEQENPDPDEKIKVDEEGLINVVTTAVPALIQPGQASRVHVVFKPGTGKWNNEAEPLRVWIDTSEHFETSMQLLEVANAKTAASDESRIAEFEIKTPKDLSVKRPGVVYVSGYALYNACETENGQCKFRRLKFSVPIGIAGSK